jgi:hypothetical protein
MLWGYFTTYRSRGRAAYRLLRPRYRQTATAARTGPTRKPITILGPTAAQ